MSRAPRLLPLVLALAALAGCEEHGVSLGGEEPCIPEPRLTTEALLQREPLSPCATIGANLVQNGGFEAPVIESDCEEGFFCQFPDADVPGWQTSSSTAVIEIWNDGHRGVPAVAGSQFAELDANSPDVLWQDFVLPPGQLMYWLVLHRGRITLEDMELELGPPDAPVLEELLSSAPGEWYEHSGLYRVGEEEPVTRLSLISRSGLSEGNLVDEITLAPVRLR